MRAAPRLAATAVVATSDVAEGLGRDRLGDVVVHPGGEARLAVALHGVGGHRDDPRPGRAGPAAPDPAGRLEAVELRHLDVHQDDVVVAALERRDRLAGRSSATSAS